jgi:hypothetical protein
VNFNSTNANVDDVLEDLTTTNNGPIKLQSVAGSITVNAGTARTLGISAHGTGTILLQTVDSGSITVNAGVNSQRGAITLLARQDIVQNFLGDLSVTDSVNAVDPVKHSIYARAIDGSITMNRAADPLDPSREAVSQTQGGNIYYRAAIDVTVGILNAKNSGVWVEAGRSILDGQGDTVLPGAAGFATATGDPRVVNVDARTAVLQAGGSIGVEGNPIDTNVDVIAAASKDGIFIRESNQLIVGQIASSTVQRVHFRSDTAPVTVNPEFGLRATDGPIRVLTEQQNLFIDRTINASQSANASPANLADDSMSRREVTLVALQGAIEQRAGTSFSITSDAAIGSTTLNLADTSSFTVGMRIAVWDADSGRQDFDVIGVGVGTIQLNQPLTRTITAATSQVYQHQAQVVGGDLKLSARDYAHVYDASVKRLFADTGNNKTLDAWEHVNINASQRGDDFLVDLETKIPGLTFTDAIKRQYRFAETYASSGYSLYIVNNLDIQVQEVTAGISASPNIYLETLGLKDITVEKPVQTMSTTGTEGAIILVAGNSLKITQGAGRLETFQNSQLIADQLVNNTELNSRFFHFLPTPSVVQNGVPGIPPTFFTTQTILPIDQITRVTDTINSSITDPKHVLMQVAIQFGSAAEKGFESFIAYADKNYALGNATDGSLVGTVGLRSQINGMEVVQAGILPAAVKDGSTTGLFVRLEPFNADFIRNSPDNTFINHASLRRANDFFMFEKASGETGDIKDLTVQTDRIDVTRDAFGLANTAAPDPSSPVIRPPQLIIPPKLEEPIVRIETASIEFVKLIERQATVTLYRLSDFEDMNEDGQPDAEELPEINLVLQKLEDATGKVKRVPFPEGTEKTSVQPTQAEINRIREALQRDPEAEVGVYLLIRETPTGKKEIIEIIPIRDSEAPQSDENEEVKPIEPAQKPAGGIQDGAFYEPPAGQRFDDIDPILQSPRDDDRNVAFNPTVSLAVMLGAISLRSTRNPESKPATTESDVQFARGARRKRRREALLQAWSQTRNQHE